MRILELGLHEVCHLYGSWHIGQIVVCVKLLVCAGAAFGA